MTKSRFKPGETIWASPEAIGIRTSITENLLIGKKYKAVYIRQSDIRGTSAIFTLFPHPDIEDPGRELLEFESPYLGSGNWKLTKYITEEHNTDTWKMPI